MYNIENQTFCFITSPLNRKNRGKKKQNLQSILQLRTKMHCCIYIRGALARTFGYYLGRNQLNRLMTIQNLLFGNYRSKIENKELLKYDLEHLQL
jgi:hypothetical protein